MAQFTIEDNRLIKGFNNYFSKDFSYLIGDNLVRFINFDLAKVDTFVSDIVSCRLDTSMEQLSDSEVIEKGFKFFSEIHPSSIEDLGIINIHMIDFIILYYFKRIFKKKIMSKSKFIDEIRKLRFDKSSDYINDRIWPYYYMEEESGRDKFYTVPIREYQQNILELFLWVLDVDNQPYNTLDIQKRLFLYNYYHERKALLSYDGYLRSYSVQDSSDLMSDRKLSLDEAISTLAKLDLRASESYYTGNFWGSLMVEFIKMVENNMKVRRCRNCGKYFIVSNMNIEYCDNIAEGENKACSEIGSNRSFSKKLKQDPLLEAYNRAYKTRFARVRYSKKMSQAEFNEWYIEAKNMLESARSGEITSDEFQIWLKS